MKERGVEIAMIVVAVAVGTALVALAVAQKGNPVNAAEYPIQKYDRITVHMQDKDHGFQNVTVEDDRAAQMIYVRQCEGDKCERIIGQFHLAPGDYWLTW